MRGILIYAAFIAVGLFMISFQNSTNTKKNNTSSFEVEHVVQGFIGTNHLANLVYRKGISGDKFTGWGRTPVTEWPVGSASKKQVVPSHPDKRYSNGGCAMDIDGDGFDEIVTACGSMANLSNAKLIWLKEIPEEKHWQEFKIASIWPGGYIAPHDIVPYIKESDTGKNFKAVLANKARNEMHLFVVPENPEKEKWPHYLIGKFPVNNQSGVQLADINNDGNVDIVSGNFWLEAPDDPTQVPWAFHRFCQWDDMGKNRWGGMNYHAVADFTGDGLPDIALAEAEIPDARFSLFVRNSADGKSMWKEIPIDEELQAPHSLIAVDLNEDGKTDLVAGEMTAGGWDFPLNPNPKIYAYMNTGHGKFEKSILYEGWGVHEMKLFPKLYNGKIMIYAADEIQPQKFDNMNTHVSYWIISPE